MTRNTANASCQPTLDDLMVRFLASRSDAAAAAVEPAEGEVVPHEVATGFRVDPRAAWTDATTAIDPGAQSPGMPVVPLPNDWATVVNQLGTAFAVPMAAGNYPQQVRDLHPLLTKFAVDELRPNGSQLPFPGLAGLRAWITKHAATQPVLASGLARLIGDFDTAERLLPPDAINERAALLWQRGFSEEALAEWNRMPDSPNSQFNRGMALLFLGRLTDARSALAKAVAAIPETSGWNALARLYLAVAEIHG